MNYRESQGKVVSFVSLLILICLFLLLIECSLSVLRSNNLFQTKEFIDTLLEKQMNFRRFFLSLLASEKKREAYLANDFKCDYDAEFMKKLQKLTNTFLDDIRKKMPLTAVEEVINLTKKCGAANFPSLN